MEVLRLDRSSAEFYALMGPVFGSRAIEKATHDRFFDDEGKRWYYVAGRGAASMCNGSIRNFWAGDGECASALLRAMLEDSHGLCGVVPRTHAVEFERLGFSVSGYKKNFIEVCYEKD
ncbi:MAG: hypothetical protein ACI4P5_09840 [Candidatus Fimadaptatus sp.]